MQVRYPLDCTDSTALPAPPSDSPLRMLDVGRCERRKGVQDLIAALTALTTDWRLTSIGLDTAIAPLGRSMRRTLQLQAADDHRITFQERIPRAELPPCMAAHDVMVLMS